MVRKPKVWVKGDSKDAVYKHKILHASDFKSEIASKNAEPLEYFLL